jgi:hypothetical protein
MDVISRCLTAVALLLTIPGCGGSSTEGRVSVHPVSGKVTMNGAPLAGASVAFAPRDGQPTAMGLTDSQGDFVLTTYESGDGAAAGNYGVVVTKYAAAPAKSDGGADAGHAASADESVDPGSHDAKDESGGDGSGNLLPPAYGNSDDTPLSAKVEAGKPNSFEFQIQ